MTDINNWKDQRFVVIPSYLDVDNQPKPIVILTDIGYWVNHADELLLWCSENNFKNKGMTVTLPDEKAISLFCLRWS